MKEWIGECSRDGVISYCLAPHPSLSLGSWCASRWGPSQSLLPSATAQSEDSHFP